jgi:hypothetical protein
VDQLPINHSNIHDKNNTPDVDFTVCDTDTISPATANTEDWLRAILDGTATSTSTAVLSPPSSTATASPYLLQASSPSSSSSDDALLRTPLVNAFDLDLFPGDGGETTNEMERLLAMLPAVPAPASPGVESEDTWMSNWLKEEPTTAGVF